MLEYITYKNGNPLRLVIFLHGYNSTISNHQYAIDWLCEKLPDTLIVIPKAPEISDKNPERNQWFGMLKYDSEGKRTQPETSSSDIFAIYNAAGNDMKRCSDLINQFIDEVQAKYKFDDEHTYLIGFSQGAMLTIYAALNRTKPLIGAFALSGLVAGSDLLDSDIKSRPPLYMFHGEDDLKVQYKTLSDSVNWLQKHGVNVQVQTYHNLAHKISEEEVDKIAEVINKH